MKAAVGRLLSAILAGNFFLMLEQRCVQLSLAPICAKPAFLAALDFKRHKPRKQQQARARFLDEMAYAASEPAERRLSRLL